MVTDCKFFIECCDKNICHNLLIMLLLLDFLTKIFLKYSLFIIHVLHIIIIHETSMYIHIMYIIAHIHEGLNPKRHGNAPRCAPPNHYKPLNERKFKFIIFDMELILKFKI
jgi:hypothetical protein